MASQAAPSTIPRPRPPAHKRRASAIKASPPPPYAAAFPSMDSGVSPGRHSANVSFDGSWPGDWSRDGTSQLLSLVDQIMTGREDVTAAACKQLYNNARALKTRHQELLSRLPSPSPTQTPLSSPKHSLSPLNHQQKSSDSSYFPSDIPARRRRISISPADIANLSDQNAELLDKLESLEVENVQVKREGRMKMNKLDSEILYLRAELEKMQVRNDELEERAIKGEREMRRMENGERCKEIRSANSRSTHDEDAAMKNFAPDSMLSTLHRSTDPSYKLSSSISRSSQDADPESLFSQLESKLLEREAASARLSQSDADTLAKIRAFQEQSESMSRIYEYLDYDELEIVDEEDRSSFDDDDDTARLNGQELETIRFTSLRRAIDQERVFSLPSEDAFEKDIQIAAQSTVRSSSSASFFASDYRTPPPLGHKSRKSVVGLFNSPNDSMFSSSDNSFVPASAQSSCPPSPALSALSVTSNNALLNLNATGLDGARTLERELGDDWSPCKNRASRHHYSASIYDLLSLPPSTATSPTKLTAPELPSSELSTAIPQPVPPSLNPRISLQPPTPQRLGDSQNRNDDCIGKASPRYRKMSQTVRMRTGRWAEGRFQDKPPIGKQTTDKDAKQQNQDLKAKPSTLPLRRSISMVLESMTEALSQELSQVKESTSGPASVTEATPVKEIEQSKKKRDRVASIMLELWLWLQFIIIIAVFLYAMAKRGPRVVFKERQARATRL